MFSDDLRHEAQTLLAEMRASALMMAAAESCTGGLIMALMTDIAGSSSVVERGFVTYSNRAKEDCLGVHPELIRRCGAVSEEVARAMAEGALVHSGADIAISVTGIAGPEGGTPDKPVGLVHMAVALSSVDTIHVAHTFQNTGRHDIRMHAVSAAIKMLREVVQAAKNR